MEERTTTIILSLDNLASLQIPYIDKYMRRVPAENYEVTICPVGFKRNSKQNRFYHYLIDGISKHTGMDKSEVTKELKRMFLNIGTESSELNNVEMGAYIEKIVQWAVADGNGEYGKEFIEKYKNYRGIKQ